MRLVRRAPGTRRKKNVGDRAGRTRSREAGARQDHRAHTTALPAYKKMKKKLEFLSDSKKKKVEPTPGPNARGYPTPLRLAAKRKPWVRGQKKTKQNPGFRRSAENRDSGVPPTRPKIGYTTVPKHAFAHGEKDKSLAPFVRLYALAAVRC